MSPLGNQRPLRADARRNVELLLAAARTVFTEQGVDAPLDEVARRAGVGNATLYRRFPTRQALLEALYEDRIAALCARARELAEDAETPPAEALDAWLRELVRHGSSERGLTATLAATLPGGPGRACGERVLEAASPLLAQARRAGAVRPDVTMPQLLRLVSAVAHATEGEPDARRQADHLLSVIMDGLRHGT
ncbi:TetR/AcrR family transcriptional regulator [Streptomyces albiaxialis]|uniref:TetR/AcrR family transcriptional regulator n=1 Tax=Streptomyces albiaxialis TaxID=329523 RepID=A0ABN2W1D5_9ACTN